MTDKLPLPPIPNALEWNVLRLEAYGRECQRLALEAAEKKCQQWANDLGEANPSESAAVENCVDDIRRMIEELK